MKLYPRLFQQEAQDLAQELAGVSVQEAESQSATDHPATYFAPTGGDRVVEVELQKLRQTLIEVSKRHGYPEPQPRGGHAAWDRECASTLYELAGLAPAEAAQAGVWSFIGCVLLPDLVRWRFPGDKGKTTAERFLGAQRGIRNTFGRLWWRYHLLEAGDERDSLIERLSEDQLVQITERPVLAASREVSRSFGHKFLDLQGSVQGVRSEDLMRDSIKRLRRLGAILALDSLKDKERHYLFLEVILDSARALGGRVSDLDRIEQKAPNST